jgi:DNA-binding MarR family transcriptional regulator
MQRPNDGGFLIEPGSAANAASLAHRGVLHERATQIRFSRDLRRSLFNRNIFGEPAWDILLALYVIDRDQRRLSTRELSTLAGHPLTTALRWLDYLEEQDLIDRATNPFDQRVIYVELSAKGRAGMDTYLTRLNKTEILAPIAAGKH